MRKLILATSISLSVFTAAAAADVPIEMEVKVLSPYVIHVDIDGSYSCDSQTGNDIYFCSFNSKCEAKDSNSNRHCVEVKLDNGKHRLTASTQGQQAMIEFQLVLEGTHYTDVCSVTFNDYIHQVIC